MTETERNRTMLAGYISGTRINLARVRERKGEVYLYDRSAFKNRDFSDFEAILGRYLKQYPGDDEALCLGVAGPVINNEVRTTNLPWYLSGSSLQKKFSFERVQLVNDLVATAHGLFVLKKDRFYTINEGIQARQGNIGLLAAGAGLGEALIMFGGDRYIPYASEGGHAGFAPGSQDEVELWEYLYAQQGYVEVEDVISLSGMVSIYLFMLERERAVMPDWFKKAPDKAPAIIEHALSGGDPVAVRSLDLFVGCYASEVATLALKGMTLGGIYLGGVIAPQIITAMDQGRFIRRFVKKGKMEALLADIPVGVILDDKTALLGAAAMLLTT